MQAVLLPPLAPQASAPLPELTLAEEGPLAPPPSLPSDVPQSRPAAQSRQRPPLDEQLANELLYPPAAIAQGLEGEAWVRLIFDEHGRVSTVSLVQSSGHALLDRAALRAARRLHAPEATLSELILPVRFRLE